MSDEPKRTSTEPTLVAQKAPMPASPASAEKLEQDNVETLVACPWCEGHGMVTPTTDARWRANYPEVADKEPIVP